MKPPNHIENAIELEKVPVTRLDDKEEKLFLIALEEKFSVHFKRMRRPWETRDAASVRRFDGWKVAADFVKGTAFLLIDEDGDNIWRVSSSDDLLAILGSCPAVDYYLSDEGADFLICSNTHDYLVGWGRAADWITSLPDSTQIN